MNETDKKYIKKEETLPVRKLICIYLLRRSKFLETSSNFDPIQIIINTLRQDVKFN